MPEQPVISIDDITLQSGKHEAGQGFCFMEAAAFIAGEDHSDHPACVCRVLGIFARRWNDYLKTKDRQKMKPYIRLVIGTAGDGFGERRSWMIIDWCVREVLVVSLARARALDLDQPLLDLDLGRALGLALALARDLAFDLALERRFQWRRRRPTQPAALRSLELARALDKIRDSGFALMDRMVMLEMRTMERTQQDTASTLVEK